MLLVPAKIAVLFVKLLLGLSFLLQLAGPGHAVLQERKAGLEEYAEKLAGASRRAELMVKEFEEMGAGGRAGLGWAGWCEGIVRLLWLPSCQSVPAVHLAAMPALAV